MKVQVLFCFFVVASIPVESAMYRTYKNKSFPNLQFSVLATWETAQNGKEIIFYTPGGGFPQLFLQTVGKWKDVNSLRSFYQFEIREDNIKPIETKYFELAGYPAVEYTSLEHYEGGEIKQITLIVDVGKGFIWLYQKSDIAHFQKDQKIFNKIKATFKF